MRAWIADPASRAGMAVSLLLEFGLGDGSISEMSAGYRDAEKMSGPQIT